MSLSNYANMGNVYVHLGRVQDAEATIRRGLQLNSEDPGLNFNLGSLLVRQGRVDEGRGYLDRFLKAIGPDPMMGLSIDIFMAHYSGDEPQAIKDMQQYEAKYCDDEPSACATFYSMRNMRDEAFAWLEKSYAIREPGLPDYKEEGSLESLRNDPRWGPFWRKVGFPAE